MNKEDLLLTPEEIGDAKADAVLEWATSKKQIRNLTPREIAEYSISNEIVKATDRFMCQAQLDKVLREILSQLKHGRAEHGMEFYGMTRKDYEALKAIIPEVKER